ncbi:MAG TPA: efflux RND transporter periplasmic adaptor subunit [Candidatus Acidoferrales bacterium]|nr:efflux RND transporter periplasmic adaptor subunit [Candidatus Acidoferrales bacterium]
MIRKRTLLVIGAAATALAGLALYAGVFRRAEVLEGSGTVEARNIRVGSKVGGRVLEVRVREGDRVETGQVLVTFDDQELLAALEQARANLEKMERGFRPEEIAEARATSRQARADYEQRLNGSRKEDIEAARADVERTRADAIHTERNFKRVSDLANADVFSKQQRDDAEAAWRIAVAAQRNAEEKLAELELGYRPEEIASAEARYQQTEATRTRLERGNRREDIDYARAGLRDAESRYRERGVLAPSAATVEVLDVRPGDLIAPNTPIATLLERDQLYVRIYVPETKIGRVRVGQQAEVHVDSFPKEVFPAEVEQINQKAEFLPRNVETKEERVHQVFGIKLRIKDPSGRVRAGMAADVKLRAGTN